jgi:phosphomannomutase
VSSQWCMPSTIAFSNIIEHAANTLGAEVIYTPVGEPYLAQAKLMCSAQIGLEEHGSVLLEWSREGPMLAGVIAGILVKEEKTLSELVASNRAKGQGLFRGEDRREGAVFKPGSDKLGRW